MVFYNITLKSLDCRDDAQLTFQVVIGFTTAGELLDFNFG